MIISIPKEKLFSLFTGQLQNLFGLDKKNEKPILSDLLDEVLEQTEHCFSYNKNKYYHKEKEVYFHPFHSGQYTIFLYILSRTLSIKGQSVLADKVYYLNKTLNGVDLYHQIELPKIFGLDHPVGTVLGRAKYSNFFYFSQNCTVGNNHGIYPTFEEHVILLAGATIIGKSRIGKNCLISANTYIKDQDVPANSLVFGSSPNLNIKQKEDVYFWENSKFFPTASNRPLKPS